MAGTAGFFGGWGRSAGAGVASLAETEAFPETPVLFMALLALFFGEVGFIGCLRRGLRAEDTEHAEF
jgi:hypothetical protein